MGLDMYLNKKHYIFSDGRGKLRITGIPFEVDTEKVKEIVEEAGYWRKANAIHNWFVKNVQDGNDDCKEYYVSREDMAILLDLIDKVLGASKLVKGKVKNGYHFENGKEVPIMEDGEYVEDATVAEKLLPTTSGFFFGMTDYDQYYIDNLKETKEILEEALKDKNKGSDYYYESSW